MTELISTRLSAGSGVQDTALTWDSSRLATVAADGSVHIFERGTGAQLWSLSATWTASHQGCCKVAWGQQAFSASIAVGYTSGEVEIWAESVQNDRTSWQLSARLKFATKSILDLRFAPEGLGRLLAVASADGHVRMYQASATSSSASWQLQNAFRACANGPCHSLSWRPSLNGALPLILVGTAEGAQVWAYNAAWGQWSATAEVHKDREASSVHWAPALGRSKELVAVASGNYATVYSLTGPTDALQVSLVAELAHEARVTQVEWNAWGTWLAAATEDCQIQQWRSNLAGAWGLHGRIVGTCKDEDNSSNMSSPTGILPAH